MLPKFDDDYAFKVFACFVWLMWHMNDLGNPGLGSCIPSSSRNSSKWDHIETRGGVMMQRVCYIQGQQKYKKFK